MELANAIFGRYTAVVEGIVEANSRLALSLEVDELRYGADLIDLSNRQEDLVARIVAEVIFATFGHGGLEQRDDIAAVSALLGRMRSNDASLRARTRPTCRATISAAVTRTPPSRRKPQASS